MKYTLLAAAAFAVSAASSHAATIDGGLAGIADADVVVNFTDGRDTSQSSGSQFSGLGVTFSEPFTVFTNNPNRANFSGNYAGNFGFVNNNFAFSNPLTITFATAVDAASLNMSRNLQPNMTTFQAFLGGTLVEAFTTSVAPASNASVNNFYGFEGITFDSIAISFNGSGNGQGAGIDNVAYSVAPPAVPLPASLPLLLAGFGGFAFLRRRKS